MNHLNLLTTLKTLKLTVNKPNYLNLMAITHSLPYHLSTPRAYPPPLYLLLINAPQAIHSSQEYISPMLGVSSQNFLT